MQQTRGTTIVLVEGESDRLALTTLAARTGPDLAVDGVEVVVMHGITNTRTHARRLGPLGAGHALAGLYDSPAEGILRDGLAAAGVTAGPEGLRALGFHACVVDLEDELVRAVGLDRVEAVIEAEGEGRSLRLLAGMPAQRAWSREEVLRRFLTSQSGRKARYAQALAATMDLDRAPRPLTDLLAHVRHARVDRQ